MEYCLDCGNKLRGRTDKKFCDDHCRCHYNNAVNKERNTSFKGINSILRRNACILERLCRQGIRNTTQDMLVATGFNFTFFTHQLYSPNRGVCNCCYDYGYIKVNEKELMIQQSPHSLYTKPDKSSVPRILKFE